MLQQTNFHKHPQKKVKAQLNKPFNVSLLEIRNSWHVLWQTVRAHHKNSTKVPAIHENSRVSIVDKPSTKKCTELRVVKQFSVIQFKNN
jgi:hypothetical protein